jgi:hypothetical protein
MLMPATSPALAPTGRPATVAAVPGTGANVAEQPLSTRAAEDPGNGHLREPRTIEAMPFVVVGEPVEAGDVLVADADAPGVMRRGTTAADRSVIGIVAGEPGMQFANGAAESLGGARGEAPVTLSGFAVCKVDASYGAIRVGDLLATSPTAGRAMRADEPAAGTILGKALEPLASGTGTIRVLVTLR